MLLLSSLVVACSNNPQQAQTTSYRPVLNKAQVAEPQPELARWPYPEQEHWVEEPVFNGKLHLVETGKQNQQAIVLIHGLGDRGILDWQRVIAELADNYHVIAIDLPGFGSSDKHQVQYAPAKYAQLVDWVVNRYAHESVIVVGHSMGGAVSLSYAHSYPGQLSRLILVDAAGILQRTVFIKHIAKVPVTYDWLKAYQQNIPALDDFIRKMASKADGWTRSLLVNMDRMPDIPKLMMSSGLAQQYLYKDRSTMNAALGLVYEDFSAAVREVDVPTQIIWGEHDTVAPIRTGIVLAGLLPDAELHVIDEAGHVPMMDRFDDFMAVLTHSLENAPLAKQSQIRLDSIEEEQEIKNDIHCSGQDGIVYSGHYKEIYLDNCHGVVLRDLVAEHIEMESSEVTLDNVKLKTSGTGLVVSSSVLTATLLQVVAKVGMVVDSSYLDMAGSDFVSSDEVIDIRNSAQLYFSLSESQRGQQKEVLHGVSLGPVLNVH